VFIAFENRHDAVAPAVLDRIHRDVGLAQQRVDIAAVDRIGGDSH